MQYLSDPSRLAAFVERASASRVLAIDTEFIREKTYYPKLCLIQMATDDEVVIIDPFTCGSLDVIAPLLGNEDICKVFHAGGQDIEILLREVGRMPWPLFDTQIAAALLGQSHQVGFGSLVHAFCGVRLSKRDSFTDWSKRPLSDSQVRYAADDVIYLPELYATMVDMLNERGRLHWLDDDFRALADPQRYASDPQTRYVRLKRVNQLTGAQVSAAREVAAWREQCAQKRNIPRKWVIGDEEIVEACKREAITIDELFMVRGVKQHVSTRDARAIVEAIKRGLAAPPHEWPRLEGGKSNELNVDAAVDMMQALVRHRAKENGIAMQTLASHSDLAALARGYREQSEVVRGWRRELIGAELEDLLAGRLSLQLEDNQLVVNRIG
ncbi:ribonuclease D [Adlercreutzia murintestinalis]|uniref:ribonuclease D n=1 Tax=Adlercreutzia murintestinalis TaxID=2941325 RepID=UPI0020418BCF|nr:ribonuclease D [Adlercreutzia murintestinalis]